MINDDSHPKIFLYHFINHFRFFFTKIFLQQLFRIFFHLQIQKRIVVARDNYLPNYNILMFKPMGLQ